jgi:dihydroneopterin aldolase
VNSRQIACPFVFLKMLTVSLHGIAISASRGLYAEEHKIHNNFEVDVDIIIPAGNVNEIPFVDYTILRKVVAQAFEQPYELLEHFIRDIHNQLKQCFPESERVKITVRKMHPPMPGRVAYAQVVFEN